jgi:hypothetical protein
MLLTGIDERRVALPALSANDSVVATSIDIAGVVENVLGVLPDTTNIAVVIGNSSLKNIGWSKYVTQQPFTNRVVFTF